MWAVNALRFKYTLKISMKVIPLFCTAALRNSTAHHFSKMAAVAIELTEYIGDFRSF